MLGRLDPLSLDLRAGRLCLGQDAADDADRFRARFAADEAKVQLDDLGSEERHQGKGRGLRAHVVERDPPALIADPASGPEQFGRSSGDRPLGQLDDDAQPFRAFATDARQAAGRVR